VSIEFSLEEIKKCLENPDFLPVGLMRSHMIKLHQLARNPATLFSR
jgi:hypothetical protein